jgi:hypothetical protein
MSDAVAAMQRNLEKPAPFVLIFHLDPSRSGHMLAAMPRDADGRLREPRVLSSTEFTLSIAINHRLQTVPPRPHACPEWMAPDFRAVHGGEEAQRLYDLTLRFGSELDDRDPILPNTLIEVRTACVQPTTVIIAGLLRDRFLFAPENHYACIRYWDRHV